MIPGQPLNRHSHEPWRARQTLKPAIKVLSVEKWSPLEVPSVEGSRAALTRNALEHQSRSSASFHSWLPIEAAPPNPPEASESDCADLRRFSYPARHDSGAVGITPAETLVPAPIERGTLLLVDPPAAVPGGLVVLLVAPGEEARSH
ncbi:hypothetical protein KC345_g121 [Hortaea werneckii]|nr:hypothetical protein KC345_g121 [Hortaea werneckii]